MTKGLRKFEKGLFTNDVTQVEVHTFVTPYMKAQVKQEIWCEIGGRAGGSENLQTCVLSLTEEP